MQNLRVRGLNEDLPFTKASDVYAFGTIWFELLTGEWPWKLQPPETVIWSVGRGVRPTLANLQVLDHLDNLNLKSVSCSLCKCLFGNLTGLTRREGHPCPVLEVQPAREAQLH